MASTRVCLVVDVPPDRLWAKLFEFGTWHTWLREIADSHIEGSDAPYVPVGSVRAVGPKGNPIVRERLVACDNAKRVITYEVADEPVWPYPAGRNYRGTAAVIALTDNSGRSVIEWSGAYDCDAKDEAQMSELLTGLYHSFIDGLVGAAK